MLTTTEQLNILKGQDGFVFPGDFSLEETVQQAGIAFTTDFLQTYKAGSESTQYYQKIAALANVAFRRQGQATRRFTEVMVGQIARQPFDYATVKGATLTQWENFISDNMDEVIEIVAGVSRAEKDEYTALP